MKKLFFATLLLLSGCVSNGAQPVVERGFAFTSPCDVHGEDNWVVTDIKKDFVYTLSNGDDVTVQVDQAALLEALKSLGITLDTK
jgi:hypothetical protein